MALRLRNVVTAQQSLPLMDIRDDTVVLAAGGLRQVLDCHPTPGVLGEALYSRLASERARGRQLVPKGLVASRVRDLIAPSGFERTRDTFTVDQRATQTLAIVGYPRFLHMDWVKVFLRLRSAARI